VAGSGAVLVGAAPGGPGPCGGAGGDGSGQVCQETADLAEREVDEAAARAFRGGRRRDRQVGVRQHGQGDVPVPGVVTADLVLVQPGLGLGRLEAFLDGLITNGKFCCVRWVRLSLSWWHRPLRLRESALQRDVALAGERDEPDLDRVPAARPVSRRRAPVGSGLPAAGAVGRRRRPAGSDADRRGGT